MVPTHPQPVPAKKRFMPSALGIKRAPVGPENASPQAPKKKLPSIFKSQAAAPAKAEAPRPSFIFANEARKRTMEPQTEKAAVRAKPQVVALQRANRANIEGRLGMGPVKEVLRHEFSVLRKIRDPNERWIAVNAAKLVTLGTLYINNPSLTRAEYEHHLSQTTNFFRDRRVTDFFRKSGMQETQMKALLDRAVFSGLKEEKMRLGGAGKGNERVQVTHDAASKELEGLLGEIIARNGLAQEYSQMASSQEVGSAIKRLFDSKSGQ